jgi:hypothetical protein
MVNVIVYQSLLRIKDGTFDRLQLLRNLQTWPTLLDHLDDCPQMTVGALEPSNDLGMALVHHFFRSSWEDKLNPP